MNKLIAMLAVIAMTLGIMATAASASADVDRGLVRDFSESLAVGDGTCFADIGGYANITYRVTLAAEKRDGKLEALEVDALDANRNVIYVKDANGVSTGTPVKEYRLAQPNDEFTVTRSGDGETDRPALRGGTDVNGRTWDIEWTASRTDGCTPVSYNKWLRAQAAKTS